MPYSTKELISGKVYQRIRQQATAHAASGSGRVFVDNLKYIEQLGPDDFLFIDTFDNKEVKLNSYQVTHFLRDSKNNIREIIKDILRESLR